MPELGSRLKLGARLHFCIRCDFPIVVYGHLSPCEHIFCLDCAKSNALCCICDERIQKIQTIKMLEDIYICAAPYCLKSFLNKTEFESHIHENHSDLLIKIAKKDDYISECASAKNPTISKSTLQAPTRSIFAPISGSQVHDREDKTHNALTRDQQPPRPFIQQNPPFTGSTQNHPLEQQSDSNPRPGFERPGMQNQLLQQGGAQGSLQPDPGHFPDKKQGIMGSSPFPEYPMDMPQPHGFAVPMSLNPGNANFLENYHRPWNMGQPAGPFESAAVQPPPDGFVNAADSQGRAILFQGEYGRNASVVPSNLPPPLSKDTRDSKGILMPQPMSLPPPPPLPHHMSQLQIGGRHYSGNTSHGGQGYGWQHEKRDNFKSRQH